ncbi:unnamed protein product [Adineta steineri]|uniref:Uncharacterized protein n=2 Tax=Adineta steineri TaxID=433720 RepID=A0A819AFE8_9BILA|nr:unnamed protein product [Adineta steineri]
MNLTMQQPITYPFYMSSPRIPFSVPWSTNPYHYSPVTQQHYPATYQTSPSLPHVPYPAPFILPHQPRQAQPSRTLHPSSSYTNTRYNHLKQATSHFTRQRFTDTSIQSQRYAIPNHQYRPSKTKSYTDLHQFFQQNSSHLLKAHSWHAINHLQQQQQQPNLNMNYANEMPFNPPPPPPPPPVRHHHQQQPQQYAPKQKKKSHRKQSSSSPKQVPDHGIVRITTLDEMPIMNNPIYQESQLDPNKNLKLNDINHKNYDKELSSSSSNSSSHSSLQKRLNGSLRNDPLLTAAMEDFRQLRQTSSRQTSITSHRRDLSRDSLCSSSTHRSISSRSRSHSQSSFTSLERLEIRRLIKTFKTKDIKNLNNSFQVSSIISSTTEKLITKQQQQLQSSSSMSLAKPKRSSVTEELDRQFRKIRSNNPDEDLIYVKPSLIHKDKPFDELLYQTKSHTIDSSKFQKLDEKTYENPILTISVPQSSPILSSKSKMNELKPEYAIPIKHISEVNLRSNKKDEQVRSFSFCKPMNDIINETDQTRPVSMLNWLQYGLTNPLPTTFQPHKNHKNQYDNSLVKENIYASDIDVHIPLSNDKDYLNNQALLKDYLKECKNSSSTQNNSILNDFSRLFTRFGNNKHEHKSKLKTKLHKNNNINNNNNNVRCSIM